MDHHLNDSLNLDTSIGEDFVQSDHDVEVNEGHIPLEGDTNIDGISMEFENIEEQPILMETDGEEIIDMMNNQYTLNVDNDYTIIQDDNTMSETVLPNPQTETVSAAIDATIKELEASENSSMPGVSIDDSSFISDSIVSQGIMKSSHLQFESQIVSRPLVTAEVTTAPTKVQTLPIRATASAPKQIAIAPKPMPNPHKIAFTLGKQLTIAPKPVALLTNKTLVKVPLSNVVHSGTKSGSSVLAKFGKKFVMIPASTQKVKVVQNNSGVPTFQLKTTNSEQMQLITNSITSGQGKTMLAKAIAGSSGNEVNQSAMLTKLVSANVAGQQPRLVVVSQTNTGTAAKNKVLIGSPKKVTVGANNKQLVAITAPKLAPAQTQLATKKILIPANPNQNVVLKGVTSKPAQTLKTTPTVASASSGNVRTMLHQIDVPGKGVQYIRLVTNPATSTAKTLTVKPTVASSVLATKKTFVITDSKGAPKKQQKLVRIAPIPQGNTTRSSQSLLAPIVTSEPSIQPRSPTPPPPVEESPMDHTEESKEELRQLIARTIMEETNSHHSGDDFSNEEVQHSEVVIQSPHREQDATGSDEDTRDANYKFTDNRFIVYPNDYSSRDEENAQPENIDRETIDNYDDYDRTRRSSSPQDIPENVDLSLRARKACNCTKSQCLKLYCDCFANGEFCNLCNCTNCHNNLDHEDLRQKAIRGCLERNPNAFRPKIGKAKNTAGPNIVRRHNKGCNCKRSGCLKNYCECYEAKIACSGICKCVGCRNVEDSLERGRRMHSTPVNRPLTQAQLTVKQPCSLITNEVIEAACQCLLAVASPQLESGVGEPLPDTDPVRRVLEEFGRCLQEIIGTAHKATKGDELVL